MFEDYIEEILDFFNSSKYMRVAAGDVALIKEKAIPEKSV